MFSFYDFRPVKTSALPPSSIVKKPEIPPVPAPVIKKPEIPASSVTAPVNKPELPAKPVTTPPTAPVVKAPAPATAPVVKPAAPVVAPVVKPVLPAAAPVMKPPIPASPTSTPTPPTSTSSLRNIRRPGAPLPFGQPKPLEKSVLDQAPLTKSPVKPEQAKPQVTAPASPVSAKPVTSPPAKAASTGAPPVKSPPVSQPLKATPPKKETAAPVEPHKPAGTVVKSPEKVAAAEPLKIEIKSTPSKATKKPVKNADLTKLSPAEAKKVAADTAYDFLDDGPPLLEVRPPMVVKIPKQTPSPQAKPKATPTPSPPVKPKKPQKVAAEKTPRKRPAPKPAVPTPEPTRESKRARTQASVYQAPDPELEQILRLSKEELKAPKIVESKEPKAPKIATPESKVKRKESKIEEPKVKEPTKESTASTAVFFKGEHLAVRNAEGSFYLCQASQNIHRHSKKIKIQWLGLAPEDNASKDMYLPEYYDTTGLYFIIYFVEKTEH